MHPFFHFLSQLPGHELPGKNAQLAMAPFPLNQEMVLPENPANAHPSGVLIPLFPGEGQTLNVILTLRAKTIRHAGQISFPGGRKEGNESLQRTALRETHEEIGIGPEQINIARKITPLYLERTNNQITPFVGFLEKKPTMLRNPGEVEEIITLPLHTLLSEKYTKKQIWNLRQTSYTVPFWDIHNVPLWGATAMMMNELVELYSQFLHEN